ncbi:MAG TPA: heme ABC exporter ATP-binding protein CcmA [Desulfobacterales bacterium]|nr:heme ABC exporter ATP-binding protein CcmA [Desulfobacterales bacterium]
MKACEDHLISARGITKSYGGLYALKGVDLVVHRGEFLSVFGPNGAGKSTLLRMLSTLSNASSGELSIAGLNVKEDSEDIRRFIGVVSHQTFLYDDLTAEENLRFYGKMYSIPEVTRRVREMLFRFGLDHRRHDPVRTFSRGMQQRLAIARALLHEPLVLFLDEPYTGLDRQAAQLLEDTMQDFIARDGTIVMATHDLRRGLQMADRFLVLMAGSIVHQGERDSNALQEVMDRLGNDELR